MPESSLHAPVLAWYDVHRRDLPWRREGVSGWEVLVSEVMLQQTPVARVMPAFAAWMTRWPTPGALALEPPGEAVRMWGRLGYPRRALRLHAAAAIIEAEYGDEVPTTYDELRTLPGVGDYTAAAVAAFAYQRRALVLDTNVRRVLTRLLAGNQFPTPHVTAGERVRANAMLPDDPPTSARWSVAVMELGAVVCAARAPRCGSCPVRHVCSWDRAGKPVDRQAHRRAQAYAGTDRQCRGQILGVLRDTVDAVRRDDIDACWSDAPQRERALTTLVDDGLVVRVGEDAFALP